MEDGRWKSEDGRWKTEDACLGNRGFLEVDERRHKLEVGRQTWKYRQNLPFINFIIFVSLFLF
jgi:hypothetical protein